MKKKIIASLVAVCMFAGMAVPAFAATTSSQSADADKVTAIEFSKTSFEVKKDGELVLGSEVTAYAGKNAIAQEPQLTWSNGGSVDAIVDANGTVTGISDKGTVTITATSQDGKVSAKATVKCLPTDALIKATGFTLEGDKTLPTSAKATTANATFTVTNTIATGLAAGQSAVLKVAGQTISKKAPANFVATANSIANLFDGAQIVVDGIAYKATVTAATIKFEAVHAGPTNGLATEDGADKATISLNSADAQNLEVSKSFAGNPMDKKIEVKAYPKDATFSPDQKLAVTGAVADAISAFNAELGYPLAVVDAKDGLVINLKASSVAAPKDLTAKFTVDLTNGFPVYTEGLNTHTKYTNAKKELSIKTVPVVVARAIAVPGKIKIEVGQTAKIKPITSNANQALTYDMDTDVFGDNTVYDFAVVDENKTKTEATVTGVAVGVNKITTRASNGLNAETIVEVVAKGTLPSATKPSMASLANMIVGNSYKIAIKNAGDAKVTFSSYNDKIATVAADGTVKAIAAGTVKIKAMVGTEALYVNVTVKAAPAVTNPTTTKPTTPAQTGVSCF